MFEFPMLNVKVRFPFDWQTGRISSYLKVFLFFFLCCWVQKINIWTWSQENPPYAKNARPGQAYTCLRVFAAWSDQPPTIWPTQNLNLTFTTLLANSADDKWMIFSYFSLKPRFDISCKLSSQHEISPANRIGNFMQIVICMKCQILFSRKNLRKIFRYVVCWNVYPERLKIKC